MRLDIYLAEKLKSSRSQVGQLIKKGLVKVDGRVVTKGGFKLKGGEKVEVEKAETSSSKPTPQEIDFDISILYEDPHLMVINKPAGVVVHPAPSYRGATLVDWLKSRGYTLSTIGGEERVGIVHRLDKGTSGALLVAKENQTHLKLAEQLKSREMGRFYLMLLNQPLKKPVIVDKPIGRNPKDRKKMGVVAGGREAKTLFIPVVENLVLAKLYTGRTHQIRVHLKELGRWILGDNLYGKGEGDGERLFLHGYQLYFTHPVTGSFQIVTAPLPDYFISSLPEGGKREIESLPFLPKFTEEVAKELQFKKVKR
jgi:23S rRNA pseudouridine1911/1915/1917 synthase